MEIIPPTSVPLMPHEVPAVTPVSREERQHDLLLHQMIRATVEEGGQEKALLNFGERKLWVETGTPLRTGDTVNLQVMENDNRLGFRLIPPNLLERLGQSLHLLDKQLNPMALLPALIEGREPGAKNLDQKTRDGLDRLFSLLRLAPSELDGRALREIPRRLGLMHEAQLASGQTEAAHETLKNALGQLHQGRAQLRRELADHLEPLFRSLRELPERLNEPQTAARPTTQPGTLAAVLRPLLRLAQSLPETPARAQAPVAPPTAPDAVRTAALAREFTQALGDYLRPFTGQTAAPLQRLQEAVRTLAAPAAEAPVLREAAQQFWNRLAAAPVNPPTASELEQTLTRLAEQMRQPATAMDDKFLRDLPRQLGLTGEGRENAALADRLDRLAQGLGRLPEALRTPEQIGIFLDRQPSELAAVLRPLFRFAASAPTLATTTAAPGLPPATAGTTPTVGIPVLPPAEIAATTQVFVEALRDYLRPFAAITDASLERMAEQLALLPQMPAAPFDQALAALGQKPTGKDLLGALFHLLRGAPERLAEGSAENLARQLTEALGKSLYQELDRVEQRQEESLRHLELWQLCRSRLGENDCTFVPLPLPFLDNGYLVARRRDSSEEAGAQGGSETFTLSLYLDLRKLGSVQIDLLYQQQELFVRFHCRDSGAARAFSAAREELGDSLGGIPLATVAVGVGAESPDKALIREIIPAERSLLDARA